MLGEVREYVLETAGDKCSTVGELGSLTEYSDTNLPRAG